MGDGGFEKQSSEINQRGGARPGAGRPPGSPNKLTKDVRAAILAAFEEVGGEAYLAKVAREDPRTFCTLLGKVLPTTLANDDDNPLPFTPAVIRYVIVDPKAPEAPEASEPGTLNIVITAPEPGATAKNRSG